MDDVLKPPGSLLLTVLRRGFLCYSYLIFFGVVVSCRIISSQGSGVKLDRNSVWTEILSGFFFSQILIFLICLNTYKL